jgi:hypothetical protein
MVWWTISSGGVFLTSAATSDTINGLVVDSLSNAPLDSVVVSSEGVSTETAASGAFSLIIPTTTRALLSPQSGAIPEVNWNRENESFSWSGQLGNATVSVLDVRGRVIIRRAFSQGPGNQKVSLADLPQGFFTVAITVQNRTTVYKILRLPGENGNSFKTISSGKSAGNALLSKALALEKSHVLIFTRSGYVTGTVTVPAGATGGALVKVRLVAGGMTIPGVAIDSLSVPASGVGATFRTSLVKGELYLLKAMGTVRAGSDFVDAEFGGFGNGNAGKDTINGVDVGVDIGTQALRLGKTGREKWFGNYTASHVYYMIVTGAGIPLTLKLVTSGGAATGAITVALVRLSPYPPPLAKPLDSLPIPVTKTVVHTPMKPANATVYLLQCSGQGKVGGNHSGMGDADYMDYDSTTGAGSVDVGDNNTDYGVGVDDTVITHTKPATPRRYWWGPWRKDRYYYTLYSGTGKPVTFLFFDVGYGDNVSSNIKIKVFSVP